jgi:hypothetical protein
MKRSITMKPNKRVCMAGMAFSLIFVLVLTGCGGQSRQVPLTELAGYLARLPVNTDSTPRTVPIAKVNISSEWGKINAAVKDSGRYVILDLSACIANGNTVRGSYESPSPSDMNSIKDNALIKGIILPSSLTSIGESAFEGCSGLTSISIPGRVSVSSASSTGNFPAPRSAALRSLPACSLRRLSLYRLYASYRGFK